MLLASVIKQRQFYLCAQALFCLLIALLSSLAFNDISYIIWLSQIPFIMQFHDQIKWLSNNMMFGFYIFFLVLLIFAYVKKNCSIKLIAKAYFITQLLGSILIVSVLKRLLGHARPSQLIHNNINLQEAWIGPTLNVSYQGFPSGHSCDYMISCLYLALFLPKPWMQTLLICIAVLQGFFRIALAKHFPIDVMGGFLVASLSCLFIWQYWLNPRLIKIR